MNPTLLTANRNPKASGSTSQLLVHVEQPHGFKHCVEDGDPADGDGDGEQYSVPADDDQPFASLCKEAVAGLRGCRRSLRETDSSESQR